MHKRKYNFYITIIIAAAILFQAVLPLFSSPKIYYDKGSSLTILSLKGLNLRAKPNKNSKILETVSFGETVRVISKTEREYEIDDVKGFWVKVIFDDRIGYMFDGFLSKYPAPISPLKKKLNMGLKEYYQNYLAGMKNVSYTSSESKEDASSQERLVLPSVRVEEAAILGSLLLNNFDKYKFSKSNTAFQNGNIDVKISPVKNKEDEIVSYEVKETYVSGGTISLIVKKLENESVEIIHKFESP